MSGAYDRFGEAPALATFLSCAGHNHEDETLVLVGLLALGRFPRDELSCRSILARTAMGVRSFDERLKQGVGGQWF